MNRMDDFVDRVRNTPSRSGRRSRSHRRSDERRYNRNERSRSRCSRGRQSRASTRSRSPILPHARATQRRKLTTDGSLLQSSRQRVQSPPRDPSLLRLSRRRMRSPSRDSPERQACSSSRHPECSRRRRSRCGSSPIISPTRCLCRHRSSNDQPAAQPQRPQKSNKDGMNAEHLFNSLNSNSNLSHLLNFMSNYMKTDHSQRLHYDKNIIPEFDPTIKNHRIENWISKVNECASIYKWSDQQIPHFALPRLVGHAKKWYEGLQSINRTWSEWQDYLKRAFPSKSNYGVLLSDMLERRFKIGESLDNYYYDKMMLLNACGITSKKAVDCIIHGLDDRTIRASASSVRFTEPEQLLGFLKDICSERNDYEGSKFRSNVHVNDVTCCFCKKTGHNIKQCRALFCYNCKQHGHRMNNCSQPLVKCDTCQKIGHKKENCFKNKPRQIIEKRTMNIASSHNYHSKFFKQVSINDNPVKVNCFIDFGSDCSLISKDLIDQYSLMTETGNLPTIKGIGETCITPLGKTNFKLGINSVHATITAYIVNPDQLHVPLLIGQNLTELPHILVIKTNETLEILNRESCLPDMESERFL